MGYPKQEKPAANGEGVLDAALAIAERRREILARLRKAVEANNKAEVFRLAKELVGLKGAGDETSDRAD